MLKIIKDLKRLHLFFLWAQYHAEENLRWPQTVPSIENKTEKVQSIAGKQAYALKSRVISKV